MPLRPRKSPVQERSIDTVQAIHEAAIQVLSQVGAEKLTTIRVAERAGVSVGTLYQYYPNKHALLFTMLENHLTTVAGAIERGCLRGQGQPLPQMVESVVSAFIRAKMEARQKSVALYSVAPQFRQNELSKTFAARSRRAIEAMLRTSHAISTDEIPFASLMFYSALTGTTGTVLSKGAPARMLEAARHHLILMLTGYLSMLSGSTRVGQR